MKNILFVFIIYISLSLLTTQAQASCYSPYQTVPGGPDNCGFIGSQCPSSSANSELCCQYAYECNESDPQTIADPSDPLASQKELDEILCPSGADPECAGCVNGGGVYTAIGCIDGDATDFTGKILQFAIGIGGGISFLMLIYGAFLYVVSAGDPKALDTAKQTISGALTGLVFIIFSVVILTLIGVQILSLPGF